MLENNNLLFAFGITMFAGLSTVVGSLFACYAQQTNRKFLSAALGLSAGVMIYVSMIEIFPEARASLSLVYGDVKGYWLTTIAFFAGIALIAIIDMLVPSADNPHEIQDPHDNTDSAGLLRSLFSALAVAIHNFPEGLATFVSAMEDPKQVYLLPSPLPFTIFPRDCHFVQSILRQVIAKAVLYSLLSGFQNRSALWPGIFFVQFFK